jgi:RNA-directed DNA polymerase
MPGGLVTSAAPRVDDVVEAGCPVDGQVRLSALPDADELLNAVGVSLPVRTNPTKVAAPLYRTLCRAHTLEKAWVTVRTNAFRSASAETQAEARQFDLHASSSLRSLLGKLAAGSFTFKPARGVLLRKPGAKKKRPVVIAPIESRIVQRALLDVIQAIPVIASELHAGFNFGGVEGNGLGVPGAIGKAVVLAQQGGYYIRTDIQSFFTAVRRADAVAAITAHFPADEALKSLFNAAVEIELQDAASFADEDLRLFPLADEGVAQGSCLSPMLCNYLLRDFDREMNQRGVQCIRYIDDFILFAKDKRSVTLAFRAALRQLAMLGLSAYDPFNSDHAKKAEHGRAESGFHFLGCEVSPRSVRPSAEKRASLVEKVSAVLQDCVAAAQSPAIAIRSRDQVETFAGAILAASNIVRAWGNTYSFCSDDRLMGTIDGQLQVVFQRFRQQFAERMRAQPAMEVRRALGLFSLLDCNRDTTQGSARNLTLGWPLKQVA